jgi:very-short-patch-repair endonuclease
VKCLEKSCHIYKDIWSSKNTITPEQVALNSNKKYWFKCDNNHEYKQSPGDKTQSNTGCSFCVNKTELKVFNFLKEADINFKFQYKIEKINRFYDFYLKDYNLIIEIDGDQHFTQVSNWMTSEKNLENDIQKMEVALNNGMSILRIYQPDIWNDKIDWKVCILDTLLNIRILPPVIYISSDPKIYNNHSGV